MFGTKEGGGRPAIGAARVLTMGLALGLAGCAETGGLRSVWPDRPQLSGLWPRKPQPAPDPANDYYAQQMQAARERSNLLAKRSGGEAGASSPATDEDSGPPGPDEAIAAEDVRPAPASRPSRRDHATTSDPSRDASIRVTLGAPEPLPAATRPADATLASAPTPSPSESDPEASQSPVDRDPTPRRARQAEGGPESVAAAAPPQPPPRRPAAAPKRSAPSADEARAILARSEAKLKSLGTYQVKLSRVERVDGRLQPEEEVILSVHRQPREVRLSWASGASQGREVIYSTRVDARSLFVHMPKSAIPLPTMKMAIDSPMVTRSSRHSITEAGFDTIVENLRKSVDQVDATNTAQGRAAYRGVEKPPGLDRPSHVFTRKSPNGETWTVFIDTRSLLPSMVVAKNPSGDLDEKYVYQQVSENPAELAAADAFDPDKRWGESKGLLSRFARGASGVASPGNGQSGGK